MRSLLEHTARVTLELGNQCQLAPFHKLCPAHSVTEPVTLPERCVREIMDYMAAEEFGREIAYHNYSEPLIDPRLFNFIDYCNQVGAAQEQYILTNGVMLTQTLLDELVAHGVTQVWCSGYTKAEEERLKKLEVPERINWQVLHIGHLDERLKLYDRPFVNLKTQCCEPLENLLIRATGDVALCCMDWAGSVTFGNVKDTPLKEILGTGKMQAIWRDNMAGKRHLDVCRRCISKRISKLK